MTETGQVSLADCVYSPSYSVKCISRFMLMHLITSQIRKCKILKFDFLENEKSFSSEMKNIFPSLTSAFVQT